MKKKSFRIIGATLLVVILITLVIVIFAKKGEKVTRIGFYDISDKYISSYSEVITKDNNENIEFITLSDKDINDKNITKKIDILITNNGAITQRLKRNAIILGSDITSRFPRTINSSPLFTFGNKQVIFPLSLDLFETLVLATAVTHYDLPLASNIDEIEDFGLKAMEIYPIPLVISGGDDNTINLLFTQLVDAFGGKEGYYSLQKQIEEEPSLDNFYSYTVTTYSNGEIVTVASILDLIKKWEEKGFLSKTWRTTLPSNTAQLIEDNRTSLAFMTLSEHRNVLSDNINYYETILFPSNKEIEIDERCSIQPCVVGLSFSDSPSVKMIVNRLTSSENQELISLMTQMAPSTLQGTSFDRQADDARFLASSFPGGPIPDLATLCFTDKKMRKKMADLIRNY